MPQPAVPRGETFGKRIRTKRIELRLTQRHVAALIGLDFTYLSKLENDRGEAPGEETVRKLGDVLGIDDEELLALAGKVPSQIRERAQRDVEFAKFLRRLPNATDKQLEDLYKRLGEKP